MSDLSGKKVRDLQLICKTKGIKGYSGKSKADLLKLLTPEPIPLTLPALTPILEPKVKTKAKKTKAKKTKQQTPVAPLVAPLTPVAPLVAPLTPPESPPALKPKAKQTTKETKPKNKTTNASRESLLVPILSQVLGFESAASQLTEWLKGPPSTAGLYGASGIGKTFFVHAFAKALNYTVLELPNTPEALETPLLHNRTLHFPRVFAIQDDAEKIQKTPKGLQTHLLYIGRDKFPSTYVTGPLIQVRRPTALQIAKFLGTRYTSIPVPELVVLAEQNKSDIRHILQILNSKISSTSQGKDETIDRDAFEAHTKLYDRSLSFDRRTQFAETDPDIILCMAQESIAKLANEYEVLIKGTDMASFADCIPTQAHRVALTTAIPACLPTTARPPFCSFPLFYGKYSKREKHRKYLAQLHARRHDLETIPLLRSKLMELANELSEKSYPEIAKAILKAMQKEHITYDLLFDAYEDCCYEGSELEEFDTPLQKELKKQAQACAE